MEPHFEKKVCLGSGILFLFLLFMISLPNGVILVVLYRNSLRCFGRAFSAFLGFICATDLFVGLVVCFAEALMRLLCAFGAESIPREGSIVSILECIGITSSIMLVTAMSIDRFIAVAFPHKYRQKSKPKTVVIISTFIILFSIAYAFLQLSNISMKLYHSIDLHLHTTFPLSITAVAYLGVFHFLKKQSRVSFQNEITMPNNSNVNDIQHESRTKVERKFAVTAFFILLLLAATLIPYFAIVTVDIYCESCGKQNWFVALRKSCILFLFLNSASNPLLLIFRINQLKKSCLKVLGLNLRRDSDTTANDFQLLSMGVSIRCKRLRISAFAIS